MALFAPQEDHMVPDKVLRELKRLYESEDRHLICTSTPSRSLAFAEVRDVALNIEKFVQEVRGDSDFIEWQLVLVTVFCVASCIP